MHKNNRPSKDMSGLRPEPASGSAHVKDIAAPNVMQRENERNRVVIAGRRTDDGDQCTLIVIQEVGGTWALYPHGAQQLGVRLTTADAVTVAQAVLAGAR